MRRLIFLVVLVMFVGVANPRASSVLDFDAAADGAHSHCSAHLPSSMGSAGAVDVPAAVEAVDEEEEAATLTEAG